jgi:hypothetical protein
VWQLEGPKNRWFFSFMFWFKYEWEIWIYQILTNLFYHDLYVNYDFF